MTLVDWEDIARWQMIDRALKLPFKDPIETYSSSDHVYTGLGIPAGTTGTLPKASRTREGLGAEGVEDLGETGKKKPGGDRGRDEKSRSNSSSSDRPKRPKSDSGKGSGAKSGSSKSDSSKSDSPKSDSPKSDRERRARRRTKGGQSAATT